MQADHSKLSSDSTMVNLLSVLQQLSVRIKVGTVWKWNGRRRRGWVFTIPITYSNKFENTGIL